MRDEGIDVLVPWTTEMDAGGGAGSNSSPSGGPGSVQWAGDRKGKKDRAGNEASTRRSRLDREPATYLTAREGQGRALDPICLMG